LIYAYISTLFLEIFIARLKIILEKKQLHIYIYVYMNTGSTEYKKNCHVCTADKEIFKHEHVHVIFTDMFDEY
jgi:hypothetical protein